MLLSRSGSYSLLICLIFSFQVSVFGQNYDDLCGPDSPCDSDQWLECSINGRCACQGDAQYDLLLGKCFQMESTQCGLDWADCTPNSACDPTTCTCKCDENYFRNALGKCRLPYSSPCNLTSDQCNLEGFMQCGFPVPTCECQNKNEAVYDEFEGICKLLHQASCSVPIAEDVQKCALHSECSSVTNKCECLPDYEQNGRRRCFIPHADVCLNPLDDCDASGFQECISQHCTCSDLPETIFNPEVKMCQRLVPSDCKVIEGSQECVPNSNCDPDLRQCKCDATLEPFNGFCYSKHGDTCDPNNDLCNALGYMECSDNFNTCTCKAGVDTVFDGNTRACHLRANAACSLIPGAQTCVRGADCVPSEGAVPYRCECQFQLKPNTNGECFLPHGATCDHIDNYCDPVSYLMCGQNNTCICPPSMWYDGKACKFHLNIEGTCTRANEEACPEHSSCSNGQCSCSNGYEQADNNYECLGSFGTPCGQNSTNCNALNNLMCTARSCNCLPGFMPETDVSDIYVKCRAGYKMACNSTQSCSWRAGLRCMTNQCECLAPLEQTFQTDRCGSLVGTPCHHGDNFPGALQCVENAECVTETNVTLPGMGTCSCDEDSIQTLDRTCTSDATSNLSSPFSFISIGLIIGQQVFRSEFVMK